SHWLGAVLVVGGGQVPRPWLPMKGSIIFKYTPNIFVPTFLSFLLSFSLSLCSLPLSVCLSLFHYLCVVCVCVCVFERWFLHSPGCPGTHYVDQTVFKLTEICLPLPPNGRD
ncbi:mCG145291, partial [Mus musculus]